MAIGRRSWSKREAALKRSRGETRAVPRARL